MRLTINTYRAWLPSVDTRAGKHSTIPAGETPLVTKTRFEGTLVTVRTPKMIRKETPTDADGDQMVSVPTLVTEKRPDDLFSLTAISQLLGELTRNGPRRTRTFDPLIKSQLRAFYAQLARVLESSVTY